MKISQMAKALMRGVCESINPAVEVMVSFPLAIAIPETPEMSSWEDDGEEVSWSDDWEKEVISLMESGSMTFYRDDVAMECVDVDIRNGTFGREGSGVGLDATVRMVVMVPRILLAGMDDDTIGSWMVEKKIDIEWAVPTWHMVKINPTITVLDIQR